MQINAQRGIAPIAALIITLLVIGGGWYAVRKAGGKKAGEGVPAVETGMPVTGTEIPETVVAEETAPASEEVVTYDTNGFSPKTVTIKRGDTVVFQNKTGTRASIASGPHPTHTAYPEFDQYKTGQRGKDEFRFTFEKVGAWNYHDHLNSNMTGTVVVTE